MWHAETVARTDHLPDAGRATNRLHWLLPSTSS
jgi:hypothetical protein